MFVRLVSFILVECLFNWLFVRFNWCISWMPALCILHNFIEIATQYFSSEFFLEIVSKFAWPTETYWILLEAIFSFCDKSSGLSFCNKNKISSTKCRLRRSKVELEKKKIQTKIQKFFIAKRKLTSTELLQKKKTFWSVA